MVELVAIIRWEFVVGGLGCGGLFGCVCRLLWLVVGGLFVFRFGWGGQLVEFFACVLIDFVPVDAL